jgi:hypothetical protein
MLNARHFPVLSVFSVLSVLSVFSTPLHAQVRATGRVLNADSVPVADIPVVLHRIGRPAPGPVDSSHSDRVGRFHFVFKPDTSALYLASARYAGIEYFSPPLSTNPRRPDTALTLMVYDTSSAAPVELEARHLVVTRPNEDGSRSILDLIILDNPGRLTRIARDSLRPSLHLPLPHGTAGLEVGEGDLSSAALARDGDSLLVSGAIAPGEKQLTVQYQASSTAAVITLPVQRSGTTFNVLAEEAGIRVTGAGLTLADSQVIQGRSFHRWTGKPPAASVIRITLPGRRPTPKWLLLALVGLLGLGLGGAGLYLVLHRPRRVPVPPPDALVAAIAALDARYRGKQDETAEAEWMSYQAERARLKAELEASLAANGWSP